MYIVQAQRGVVVHKIPKALGQCQYPLAHRQLRIARLPQDHSMDLDEAVASVNRRYHVG